MGGSGSAARRTPHRGLPLARVHVTPAVVPVALEAVHELVAERGEGLGVELALRLARIDGAHAAAVGGVAPLRAAADLEEIRPAVELLAGGVRVVDLAPDDGDIAARLLRRGGARAKACQEEPAEV